MGTGPNDTIAYLSAVDGGYCSWLAEAVSATSFQVRVPAPEDAGQPEWAVAADYGETFRAILLDGPERAASTPPALVEAARQVSGMDEVVAFRAQANVMLPGTGLGRHTDVPEFFGARRWAFPDWLLVAMLHSGRYDAD